MRTSDAGRTAIAQREGCVLHAYQDSRGIWTIGVGHTGMTGAPHPYHGMTITKDTADKILTTDLVPFETAVNEAIKRPMTQNEFDACVSLAFNIGGGGFRGSAVVHLFNEGNTAAAANAFLMWEKPIALKERREEERAQFLKADASTVSAPPASSTFTVSDAQRALNAWGGAGQIQVDNEIGPQTQTALREFQAKSNLIVSGDLSSSVTIAALQHQLSIARTA